MVSASVWFHSYNYQCHERNHCRFNVVEQYNNVLTYGDVDPDVEYPKFLQALKDAGIDRIVADYQAQADEWIKVNK